MTPRSAQDPDFAALAARVEELEEEVQRLRREASEDRAAMSDWLELALAPTLHTSTLQLIEEARDADWRVSFRRRRRDARGTIYFEHPKDSVHNRTIDFPLPEDDLERRKIENDVRLRMGSFGFGQAA